MTSLIFAILCLGSATSAQAEADHAAIAKASLEQYIRPGYAYFAESSDALNQSVAAMCRKPSPAALKDTQKAFAATVETWSLVEPIRFGPVAEQHRYERIFYWPDAKGLGARQVREALGKQDQSVTDAASLSGKSVALQGLPALEYLLYGDTAGALAKGGGEASFRCRFAETVAANLAGMAKDIAAGWQDGAPYAKAYLEPGPANSAYHNEKEVTLELFKTFTTGIEVVRDQKMAKALGAKPEQARPQLAPFWRSGLSFANMADNLKSVRDLFAKGGFAQVVHERLCRRGGFDRLRPQPCHRGVARHRQADRRGRAERGSARQARSLARVAQRRRHHRRRRNLARRGPHLRFQRHGRRLNMMIDRRGLLIGAASSAALLALPCHAARAARGEVELFAAARRDDRGTYSAALFSLDGGDLRAVELPERGHDIALRPGSGEWVAFARRPGRFGVAVPTDGRPPVWFNSKPDRHFFGHGVYSADGKLLYTTENDYRNAQGIIGVRDATDVYRQIGEFPARGMEPHDVALLADGRTMVIANGGIKTHPDSGADELNLPDMKPSLVYVDLATGDLVEEQMLAPELHQLSIRHLALAAGDTVVFGCQYRGPEGDAPPLLGFHRRGDAAGDRAGARRHADRAQELYRLGVGRRRRQHRRGFGAEGRVDHLLGRWHEAVPRLLRAE